jgi:prophage regulatory protein
MKQIQTGTGAGVAIDEENPKTPRILRARESFNRAALSPSTAYAKIAKGEFPQPVRLSENRIGFLEAEIDAWILARVAERDTKFVPIVTNVTKVRQAERETARSS